ncbi:PAS domain-containing sensor histidine kinase [Maridesulfovibrio sp. FT414]|uniref:PAS domain-containing sensor histidine kinase n=1 Tax=Maridesulfovibrio sp. FT414 TaxID=2979469 RepID=UPI003D8024DA
MNSLVVVLDFIALGGILCGLVVCFLAVRRNVSRQTVNAFIVLLLSLSVYDLFLTVEWLGISTEFDFLEDYIGALQPLCWLFAFYVAAQSVMTQDLAESERRFSYAMDATSDGMWDWNVSSGKVFFSPHWYSMLGYSRAELPDTYAVWKTLLHPDDADNFERIVRGNLERDYPFSIEVRLNTKNGDWLWVLVRGKVVERTTKDDARRVVGTQVDISRRKGRELQIRRLQQYLSSIINSMPSVLIGVDSEFKVTLWNSRAASETGVSQDDALHKPLNLVFPRLDKDYKLIGQAGQNGVVLRDSHRLVVNNGKEFREDLTVYPLRTADLEGTIIQLDDVTEKLQMEEMIIQSEKMLSLGGLAAGMAHEINSPLSGIVASAGNLRRRLLEDLKSNNEIAEECSLLLENIHCYMNRRGIPGMIDSISEASLRTSKLIHNMLSFSRKSARTIEPTCLMDLMDRTYELVLSSHHKSKLGLEGVEVQRAYTFDMPLVECDASMIQQVLFNVLSNGLEAMADKNYESGNPCFKLNLHKDDGYGVIEIEDNGPGMQPEVMQNIFNAFFTTKDIGKGTGLGLSISYFIVTELHNGTMEVFSSPGEFSRFVIRLPLHSETKSVRTDAYSASA